jgi:imidazolonepropionase-like amidohydrolase
MRVSNFIIGLCAALSLFSTAAAQTPVDQLAAAPSNAERWIISSSGGEHGQMLRWTDGDTRWSRQSILLRGFVTEVDTAIRLGGDGGVRAIEVRGVTPSGDAAERFVLEDGGFSFSSPVDSGEGQASEDAIYAAFGGSFDTLAIIAERLAQDPDRSIELLPTGRATLEPLTTIEVSNGQETVTLTAVLISGFSFTPIPVWMEGDRFWGFASFLDWLPEGWQSVEAQLTEAQNAALAARAPELVARLAPRATTPVVFRNVQIYDSERVRFRRNMSVVVADGRIIAVGSARSVRIPADAQVIEGEGRTLVPGLWDSHMHYGDDGTGLLLLSQGITSARDPGSLADEVMERRRRIEAGELLGPRVLASMLIDGPGPLSAQVAVVVSNEEEARAAVQRAASEGFFGIKLYGSLDPALVPVIAEETRRFGLRLHGHVPRTMRPLEAVRAGYDEITHINFVMMQAMPDEVINASNGLLRFFGPGRYAADVDLRAEPMRSYLNELQRRGIAVDPTIAVFESILTDERGEISRSYVPFAGTLPPQIERGQRAGGLEPPEGLDRETMARSYAQLRALIAELHRRGITILAGTDGSGLELVRELEIYVEAGLSPAEALATATIIPARSYGLDDEIGAIRVGRLADLALVEGDVSADIGALRQTIVVMRDGRLMDADALRAAAGLGGRPNGSARHVNVRGARDLLRAANGEAAWSHAH